MAKFNYQQPSNEMIATLVVYTSERGILDSDLMMEVAGRLREDAFVKRCEEMIRVKGQFIEAVKMIREYKKSSLMEAKEYADQIRDRLRASGIEC